MLIANRSFAGYHKASVAYLSTGHRRFNQPFTPTNYGPEYVQGDVIGVGYRPRTGTIFFTRNGKKLDDVAHGQKAQNFFPTVGSNGPCSVHVNFGQMGFVFIEANVKKWGLAPMTGSLAPPPPYGSEQGSILLETGREIAPAAHGGGQESSSHYQQHQGRTRSGTIRLAQQPTPGPNRSPTDISLSPLPHVPSQEDIGEGSSEHGGQGHSGDHHDDHSGDEETIRPPTMAAGAVQPPPEYTSPEGSPPASAAGNHPSSHSSQPPPPHPPIPSYEAAVRGDTEY